jgi:hypothetical protein
MMPGYLGAAPPVNDEDPVGLFLQTAVVVQLFLFLQKLQGGNINILSNINYINYRH